MNPLINNQSCELKQLGIVAFFTNDIMGTYDGLICVRKDERVPCNSFIEQCRTMNECINSMKSCDEKYVPIRLDNLFMFLRSAFPLKNRNEFWNTYDDTKKDVP